MLGHSVAFINAGTPRSKYFAMAYEEIALFRAT